MVSSSGEVSPLNIQGPEEEEGRRDTDPEDGGVSTAPVFNATARRLGPGRRSISRRSSAVKFRRQTRRNICFARLKVAVGDRRLACLSDRGGGLRENLHKKHPNIAILQGGRI